MISRGLLVCLCLVFAGCTASNVPITADKNQPVDTALVGTWRLDLNELDEEEDEEEMELVAVSRAPDGHLRVTLIARDGIPDDETAMTLITVEIGGHRYASLGTIEANSTRMNYLLMRYEIESANRVQIYAAPFDELQNAVKRGWIVGNEVPDRHFSSFVLDTTREHLRRFIAAHGARVFSQKGAVIERVSEATPRRR